MGDVMVKTITSFGRSGVSDWLIQRVTAVLITAYMVFLLAILLCGSYDTFPEWKALFAQSCVRIFSTITLLSIVAHSWIGGWSVLTDYVTQRFFKLELGMDIGKSATILRLLLETSLVLLMVVYTLWGLIVIWGV
jgi:succinate dehydrogenase / fumarate reductase membrane anchor subunit